MKKFYCYHQAHLKYQNTKDILNLSKNSNSLTTFVYNKSISISHLFHKGNKNGYWTTFTILFKRKKLFKIIVWGRNAIEGRFEVIIKPRKKISFQKCFRYIKKHSFTCS